MRPISLSFASIALIALLVPAAAQQRPFPEGSAPAPKAVGDPLLRIYKVSGIRDNGGGADTGVATTFHCTSFSTVNETLRIGVRNFNASIAGARTVTIAPNNTMTISTHTTRGFTEDAIISPGTIINQGSAEIQATSVNVFCSAMIVDASTNNGQGIALHLVRFNVIPDTEE
jgi:hypothetical protein